MTIREWMCETSAIIKADSLDDAILDKEMTDEMIKQVDEELERAMTVWSKSSLVCSVTNPVNKKWTLEDFDAFIDKVANSYGSDYDHVMFAYNEEHKRKLERIFPSYRIEILPQTVKTYDGFDEQSVYIVPVDNSLPIKVVTLDE